ncbi:MAG TPA: arylsulfotransferase family protein, partial [Herpetosiphonaceae bacterium]
SLPASGPLAPAVGAGASFRTYPEFAGVITATVSTPANGTAPGLLFVASLGYNYDGVRSLMIFDDLGQPVFIKLTQPGWVISDFKRQTVGGAPYLTYHIGRGYGGWSYGRAEVLDSSYRLVDTWTIDNSFGADLHEFLLLDNGHAILMGYVPVPYDLSPFGGPREGIVMDALLQEQDAEHNVVFEWRGLQHVALTETLVPLTTANVDYLHPNALEVDSDGNWLVSNRNTSNIIKINRQSGAIIWRLGGKLNQFAFANDGGFSYQHDIRRLANGNITLLDNGNAHAPPHSRAVEYALDEVQLRATRVWQYPENTSEYSPLMSNAQRLPNGNTLIGWGSRPKFTEVKPDGTKAIEGRIGAPSYRAFRAPWSGQPAEPPRAAVAYASSPVTATVYAAWNGATDVTGYEVLAGPDAASLALVGQSARAGFETAIPLTGLPAGTCVFKIRPLRPSGPAPLSGPAYRRDLPACQALLSPTFLPLASR